MFISNADLQTVLEDVQLAQVVTATEANRNRAEDYALAETKGYLRYRYDVENIFGFEVFDYDQNQAYTTGQIVIDAHAVGYTCLSPAPAGTALTNAAYFAPKDEREPVLVMIVVDVLAYHLFSRTGARRIPEHIKTRYEQALDKLKQIRAGKLTLDLPLRPSSDADDVPQSSGGITIISKEKRQNHWT